MGAGTRLKEALKARNFTIKQLSDMAGIPLNTLYSITKRDSETISLPVAIQISQALGVDVNWLRLGYTLEDHDNATLENVRVRQNEAILNTKIKKLNSEALGKIIDYTDLLIISGRYDRPPIPEKTNLTVYGDGPAGNFPPKPEEDG